MLQLAAAAPTSGQGRRAASGRCFRPGRPQRARAASRERLACTVRSRIWAAASSRAITGWYIIVSFFLAGASRRGGLCHLRCPGRGRGHRGLAVTPTRVIPPSRRRWRPWPPPQRAVTRAVLARAVGQRPGDDEVGGGLDRNPMRTSDGQRDTPARCWSLRRLSRRGQQLFPLPAPAGTMAGHRRGQRRCSGRCLPRWCSSS